MKNERSSDLSLVEARRCSGGDTLACTTEGRPVDFQHILRLRQLIEEHFRSSPSPVFYADMMGGTVNRINSLTKFYLADTIYGLVQKRKLLEARFLLLHTQLSIKEITYELGICDPSYMCRWFRRLTGMSPNKYRKKRINHEMEL